MDTNTGEILNVVETEEQKKKALEAAESAQKVLTQAEVNLENAKRKAAGQGTIEPIARQPEKNCRHCHGRGHVGKNINTGLYVPCYCVEEPTAKKTRLWSLYLQEKFGRK